MTGIFMDRSTSIDSMEEVDGDFELVETLLDADVDFEEYEELDKLYQEMERYKITSDVLASENRYNDAEYFKELAVDRYESIIQVTGLDKGDDSF